MDKGLAFDRIHLISRDPRAAAIRAAAPHA